MHVFRLPPGGPFLKPMDCNYLVQMWHWSGNHCEKQASHWLKMAGPGPPDKVL